MNPSVPVLSDAENMNESVLDNPVRQYVISAIKLAAFVMPFFRAVSDAYIRFRIADDK
jgi:hypothetical protein